MARNKTRATARSGAKGRRRASSIAAGSVAPAAAAPPLSIVILAAGQGKRMRSTLPKVLQPLAGQPLLAHVLALARSLAPQSIHIVYGHGGERVRASFAAPAAADLHWVEQAEQLGTGHALAQAMPAISDAQQVLVLYGDVPLLRAETLAQLRSLAGRGVALLTATPAASDGYGRIVRDARGRVVRIVEERDASASERRIREINTGVLVASARALRRWLAALKPRNAQGEFYLTDIVAMAARERVPVQPLAATDATESLGINDKAQLAEAEAHYRQRRARELLARGVTLIDPARIDVRGEVEAGTDVVLDVNVVLEGPVRLGNDVHIGPHCVVSRASIGDGSVLNAHCVVQDAVIGAECRVGPFARVRPGTQLASGAHIGNFVEIKNSRIGERSKVNHLSYVGDAEVGSDVNVGAGTITCNYDGANKSQTRIGDRAFIGSGSMLVAPVTIGEEATVGAGSTITADAPAGKLTLARSRQVTIAEWQRPRRKGSGD
ncbi:MAG TPA: bifunctional UDP-N-acetylglucosamine diphosphorylase/glucosamine-1-phosphate N-acetyltransferase GlmU [Steroidobacteraceae bacterium]|nr:bifunctional UDP-N-acetylglucosamine diphosphorylase/glucosamine-1-phosphate N-acetyltransferase GlmU [Steroidobacteraceae bacterium]